MKRKICQILALSCCLLALAGCGGEKPEATPPPQTTVDPLSTAPPETLGIPVENDYMTFYYPREWEEGVALEQIDDGETMSVIFSMEVSGKEVTLFAVTMTPYEADGFLLGSLELEKTVHVYTNVIQPNRESWSAEEYRSINALQERINDIIYQFYQDPRFTPAA